MSPVCVAVGLLKDAGLIITVHLLPYRARVQDTMCCERSEPSTSIYECEAPLWGEQSEPRVIPLRYILAKPFHPGARAS